MKLMKNAELREARAVAGQIRKGMLDYWKTLGLVKRAWDEEHWKTLGYESWEAYVDGEFGAERVGLPAEHRQKAVADLRLAGMSTRAIGTTLGVDQRTVRRDLAGAADAAPEELPEQVKGHDGKKYAAKVAHKPAAAEPLPAAATDSPVGRDSASGSSDEASPGPAVATAGQSGISHHPEAAARPDPSTEDVEAPTGVGEAPAGAGETSAARSAADAEDGGPIPSGSPSALREGGAEGVTPPTPGPDLSPAGPGPLVYAVRQGAEALFGATDDLKGYVPDLITTVTYLAARLVQTGPVDVGEELTKAVRDAGTLLHRYADSLTP